jgi:hypothetical protein
MLGAWIHEFILLPMVKKTPPNLLLLMLGRCHPNRLKEAFSSHSRPVEGQILSPRAV